MNTKRSPAPAEVEPILRRTSFAVPPGISRSDHGGAQGAPAGATDVLGLFLYRTAFESNDLNSIGLSSALAVTMFTFTFTVAIVANVLLRRREAGLR